MVLDLSISTGCCAALDHIVTYLFTHFQKASKSANPMKDVDQHPALKILEHRPVIFQQVSDLRSITFRSLIFVTQYIQTQTKTHKNLITLTF